jgi:hypothetical protein
MIAAAGLGLGPRSRPHRGKHLHLIPSWIPQAGTQAGLPVGATGCPFRFPRGMVPLFPVAVRPGLRDSLFAFVSLCTNTPTNPWYGFARPRNRP